MENIAAITFDVGGTLIEPWPSVGHVYAEVAARHGVHAAPEEITQRFVEIWRQRGEFDYTKAGWAVLVDATFTGFTTILPSQSFFDELYYDFGTPKPWRIFDDVLPTIAALREHGTRLAVISNWDDRLCPLLKTLKLSREFEVIIVSAEVGTPSPRQKFFKLPPRRFNFQRPKFYTWATVKMRIITARERRGSNPAGSVGAAPNPSVTAFHH